MKCRTQSIIGVVCICLVSSFTKCFGSEHSYDIYVRLVDNSLVPDVTESERDMFPKLPRDIVGPWIQGKKKYRGMPQWMKRIRGKRFLYLRLREGVWTVVDATGKTYLEFKLPNDNPDEPDAPLGTYVGRKTLDFSRYEYRKPKVVLKRPFAKASDEIESRDADYLRVKRKKHYSASVSPSSTPSVSSDFISYSILDLNPISSSDTSSDESSY